MKRRDAIDKVARSLPYLVRTFRSDRIRHRIRVNGQVVNIAASPSRVRGIRLR